MGSVSSKNAPQFIIIAIAYSYLYIYTISFSYCNLAMRIIIDLPMNATLSFFTIFAPAKG